MPLDLAARVAPGSPGPVPSALSEEAFLLRGVAIALAVCPLLALALAGCGGAAQSGNARGADLYDTCRPCHGDAGTGDPTLGAPAIAGLPLWYVEGQLTKFREGLRGAHPADIEGLRMRPMARSLNVEGDVATVARYVASLPAHAAPATLTGGDAEAGAAPYAAVCAACHGTDGMGLEVMGAPTLVNQADWYLLRQLEKFQSGVRGTDPRDLQGQQMAAMSAALADRQAMLDVIAYIRTLRK